jgi:uncharacterized protein (TIGR00369 family)
MDDADKQRRRALRAPFLGYCGIERDIGHEGVAHGAVTLKPELTNSAGAAHGGLLMTMLDTLMAGAARSIVEDDHGMMTIDLQAQFLAPGKGRLTGEGRVVRGGGSLIFCEGEIRDAGGVIVAKATGVFRPRRAPGPKKA